MLFLGGPLRGFVGVGRRLVFRGSTDFWVTLVFCAGGVEVSKKKMFLCTYNLFDGRPSL